MHPESNAEDDYDYDYDYDYDEEWEMRRAGAYADESCSTALPLGPFTPSALGASLVRH
jgi:hypothetical protein